MPGAKCCPTTCSVVTGKSPGNPHSDGRVPACRSMPQFRTGQRSCKRVVLALVGVFMAVCVSTYFHSMCKQEDWSVFPQQLNRPALLRCSDSRLAERSELSVRHRLGTPASITHGRLKSDDESADGELSWLKRVQPEDEEHPDFEEEAQECTCVKGIGCCPGSYDSGCGCSCCELCPADFTSNGGCSEKGARPPNPGGPGGGCCFPGEKPMLGPPGPPPSPGCTNTESQPAHKVPYFGFGEMLARNNTEHGRAIRYPARSQQALNFTDGDRHIHLVYDVEHHDAPLLALDHDEECVDSVMCRSRTEFTVKFCNATGASSAMLDFASDGLLAGGSHWNCSEDGHGTPKVILRRTHGVRRDPRDDRTVVFLTSQAKYHDFFKNAKLRFGTNMWYDMQRATDDPERPRNGDVHAVETAQQKSQAQVEEGFLDQGFPGFFRDCAKTIKDLGKTVEKAIAGLKFILETMMSGRLHCDYRKSLTSWGINYNQTTGQANETTIVLWENHTEGEGWEARGGVYLDNTYATIDAALVFELDITEYVPRNAKVYINGKARVNAEARAEVSAYYESSNSTVVYTLEIPTKACPLIVIGGIPFQSSVKIPIEVGYDFKASGQAEVRASASVSGDAKFGLEAKCSNAGGIKYFNPKDDCKYKQLSEYSWDHTKKFPELELNVDASLQIWLLPTVHFEIHHVGAPILGLKTTLELKVSGGGGGSTGGNNYCMKKPDSKYGAQIATNVGLEIVVGAEVDIGFKGTKDGDPCGIGGITIPCPRIHPDPFGPYGVFRFSYPIWSGCVNFGGSAADHAPLAIGDGSTDNNAYATPIYETDGLVPGTTWSGMQRKFPLPKDPGSPQAELCKHFPSVINMSLQLANRTKRQVNVNGGVDDFWAEFVVTQVFANEKGEEPFGCLVQTGYLLQYMEDRNVLYPSKPHDANAIVNYRNCTTGAPDWFMKDEPKENPDGLRAHFESKKGFKCANGTDGTTSCTIAFKDEDSCSEIVLTTSDIRTPPILPGPLPPGPDWFDRFLEQGHGRTAVAVLAGICCICICCICGCWRERSIIKRWGRPCNNCCTAIEGCVACRGRCTCPCRRRAEYSDPFLL